MTSKPGKHLVTWAQFHKDCRALVRKLMDEAGHEWKGILSVTTGGLVPAGIVAWEMEIKVIETLGISSYAGYDDPNQKDIRVVKGFDAALLGDGAGWLVIDDLVDSGNTAQAVRDMLPQAHIATVYAKNDGLPFVDTYAVPVAQDLWVYFPWYLGAETADPQPVDPMVYSRK